MLKEKASFELLHGKPPLYSHSKSFRCLAYVHDYHLPEDKFRARSKICVFLDYALGQKGWRSYDLDIDKFILS